MTLKGLITTTCCLFLLGLASSVNAMEFDKVTVPLQHPANGNIVQLNNSNSLLVSGFNQFERWLTKVDLADYSSKLLVIPEDAQYFTTARLAQHDKQQLVFLGSSGIYRYDSSQHSNELLLATESMFRVVDEARLRSRDFSVDLGSGLSDFLLPDFSHFHLYRQQPDGSFNHFALPVSARIQAWNNNRADYSARRFFQLDVNGNGLTDLLFVEDGRFSVFLQQSNGDFATSPYYPDWPVLLSTERQADQRSDAGRSYSGQSIVSLNDITDLDGDGIPDLVLSRENIADALDRSSSFEIFFGQMSEQGLQFSTTADTRINVDSVPTEVVIADFNGDGRKDFYIPTTNIGLSTIIRVLVRGSANLDIDFYLLDANRSYPVKADFRQRATIDVSISNLRFDMPLFELADLNNDGKKTLVVGEGGSQLRFYEPDSSRLFSRRSEQVNLDLPRDSSRVRVMDLNGNGKQDIILPFDSLDKEANRNQLQLLFSR
ncbi:FG-GAP repeat domain-containing protein [Arsukibacterium sp.]|uniref:FG-GAP repeat domain-containing protein n=1 Tax=Arsukibacterium sp. TaxID=1977258 RepID=UPI002FD8ECD3